MSSELRWWIDSCLLSTLFCRTKGQRSADISLRILCRIFFFIYIKWMLRKKGISISNGINWTKGNLNCMGFFFCMLQRRWFFLLNWLGLNWNDCVYRFLHFHVSICCKFRLQFNYLLNLFLYCFRGLIKMEFWKKV